MDLDLLIQNALKRTGMTTLINNFDAIEKLINQEKLKIVSVDFHRELM